MVVEIPMVFGFVLCLMIMLISEEYENNAQNSAIYS